MADNFPNLFRQKMMGLGRAQELSRARQGAEKRYPFIEMFKNVQLDYPSQQQKGGMGEFYGPGEPGSPNPQFPTIAIGPQSKNLQGGAADTVIADMVHAAGEYSPQLQKLKEELIQNLSPGEIGFARKKYEQMIRPHPGKQTPTGTNFSNFDNFLKNYWIEGMIQHLLLPENSEIEEIRRGNPNAIPVLDRIKQLFESK